MTEGGEITTGLAARSGKRTMVYIVLPILPGVDVVKDERTGGGSSGLALSPSAKKWR